MPCSAICLMQARVGITNGCARTYHLCLQRFTQSFRPWVSGSCPLLSSPATWSSRLETAQGMNFLPYNPIVIRLYLPLRDQNGAQAMRKPMQESGTADLRRVVVTLRDWPSLRPEGTVDHICSACAKTF